MISNIFFGPIFAQVLKVSFPNGIITKIIKESFFLIDWQFEIGLLSFLSDTMYEADFNIEAKLKFNLKSF